MRLPVRLPLLLAALGALLLTFLVLQLVRPGQVTGPSVGGTFIEGVAGAPRAINPLFCDANEADRDLCGLVFRGLMRLDEYGEPQYDLADNVLISGGGLTYTVRLRPDLRWHDGAAVSADDVIFTIGQMQSVDFAGRQDLGQFWRAISVDKLDARTVNFGLKQPAASFLEFITIGLLPNHVLSRTTAAAMPNATFNLSPIGTGSWKVSNVASAGTRVSAVTLVPAFRVRDAVPRSPNFDRLLFRYYISPQATYEALLSGEVDAVGGLPTDLHNQLIARDDITQHSARVARTTALFFNLRRDSGAILLSDKAVRQALMTVLDRERIVREVLEGQALVADSLFLPDTWAYHTGIRRYTRNGDRATELLRSAGYELRDIPPSTRKAWQKDGDTLAFTLLTPDDPVRRAVAEAVAQQWRDELGVVVAVQPVRSIARDFLATRQFQVALVDLDMSGDPDMYGLWHSAQSVSGQNYTGWENKQASQWVEQARLVADRAQRALLYRQLQDALADELPAIPLYHPLYRYAVYSYAQNVQLPPLQSYAGRFQTIDRWQFNGRSPRR